MAMAKSNESRKQYIKRSNKERKISMKISMSMINVKWPWQISALSIQLKRSLTGPD